MEVKFEYRGFIVQATYYLYFVVLQCLGNQSKVVVKMKSDWKGQRKKKNISKNVSNQVLPKGMFRNIWSKAKRKSFNQQLSKQTRDKKLVWLKALIKKIG